MVEINEVLPNPTVKLVSFEVRFPNLFFLESKIGELQMKVMERLPDSSIVMRKQMFFSDVDQDGKIVSMPPDMDKEFVRKIWQFKSGNKYELNVLTNSLNIQSQYHKTYMKEKAGVDKFRDMVQFVMDSFLEITKIPILNRIGLRYIDECPIPEKRNTTFQEWYETTFPLNRFDIADASEMLFVTTVKKGDCYIRYLEQLQKKDKRDILVLDFDGFALNIDAKNYLPTTDRLYGIIKSEYETSIKKPVLEFMKKEI